MVESKIDRLADAYLDNRMDKFVYSKKESELIEIREHIINELEKQQSKHDRMPNKEQLKSGAKKVRSQLLKYYKSPERLKEMSFEDKRALLDYFFSGQDEGKERFGIYVKRENNGEVTFKIYGKYILFKPKKWKQGKQVGTIFEVHKASDGTEIYPEGFVLPRKRIFANQTLSLRRKPKSTKRLAYGTRVKVKGEYI